MINYSFYRGYQSNKYKTQRSDKITGKQRETRQLKLTLDLPQSVNSIYGRNKFGSTYLKKEGKNYKKRMIKYIREEASEQKWNKVEGKFLYMDEVIYSNRKGRDPDNFKKLQLA